MVITNHRLAHRIQPNVHNSLAVLKVDIRCVIKLGILLHQSCLFQVPSVDRLLASISKVNFSCLGIVALLVDLLFQVASLLLKLQDLLWLQVHAGLFCNTLQFLHEKLGVHRCNSVGGGLKLYCQTIVLRVRVYVLFLLFLLLIGSENLIKLSPKLVQSFLGILPGQCINTLCFLAHYLIVAKILSDK